MLARRLIATMLCLCVFVCVLGNCACELLVRSQFVFFVRNKNNSYYILLYMTDCLRFHGHDGEHFRET